ncbi:hypothetical protein SHIRM173S_12658 [Streptomyces hirsutus]
MIFEWDEADYAQENASLRLPHSRRRGLRGAGGPAGAKGDVRADEQIGPVVGANSVSLDSSWGPVVGAGSMGTADSSWG